MFGPGWIYDLIVYLYALSVLFYFADFLQLNRRVNRYGFVLLTLVWGLQTAFFVFQMLDKNYLPVLTRFETLFFYSWLIVSLSLVINYFFKVDFFVFFTNVIGFIVMVINLFSNPNVDPGISAELVNHLMFIHVTLAFLSYAAFTVSGIFSIMYLIQDRLLKGKKWTMILRRLPSIDQLEDYSFRLTTLGLPLLLLSLILGIIRAYTFYPYPVWFDPKVLTSILIIVIYSIFIYGKLVSGWFGKKLVYWNIGAFVLVAVNYFISAQLSIFHQWI